MVEISRQDYLEFCGEPPAGMERGFVDGSLAWVDRELIFEDIVQRERVWRDSELVTSDIELNKVQDGNSKSIGTVSAWRQYRNLLRDWPTSEGFPNKENRPKSPKI